MAPKKRYWLFKSEPAVFSIQDLADSKDQTTCWEGIRNYQARNFLRDDVKKGDLVLFHHSNAKPPHVAGICEVVRSGYPDSFAWDPQSRYHDGRSTEENPTWYMVDIRLKEIFPQPLTMEKLKAQPQLKEMMLLQRGSRLSIQPVTAQEFKVVKRLGNTKA